MQLQKAEEVFLQARELLEGHRSDGTPCEKDLAKSELLLNEVLNNNRGNITVLYVIASLHLTKGHFALAAELLGQIVKAAPKFGEAWNNLGLANKEMNCLDEAVNCGKIAVNLLTHPDIPCNMAGLHLNRGMPEIGLEWADMALAKDPDHVKARWHKGMALLEMGRWDEAWDYHEARLYGGAQQNIAERNYAESGTTAFWDGRSKGRVAIHGEQGMGDEIMFASCIPDAIATGAEIIIEPSPRMHSLFARTFPDAKVHGTNKVDGAEWIERWGRPDFKAPLGSLPKFYRRSTDAFPGEPFLVPCPKKKDFWQRKLDLLGNLPKVGLTWQGGVHATNVSSRSFHPRVLASLFHHDVQFVSLQYDETARANVSDIREEFGIDIAHWPKAVEARDPDTGKASDLDELAALVSCLDLVISVPQTAYHFAGALGVPCWVMTPSDPDWRLGVTGDTVPWYRSVSLIRQPEKSWDWTPVFAEVDRRLGELVDSGTAKRRWPPLAV